MFEGLQPLERSIGPICIDVASRHIYRRCNAAVLRSPATVHFLSATDVDQLHQLHGSGVRLDMVDGLRDGVVDEGTALLALQRLCAPPTAKRVSGSR